MEIKFETLKRRAKEIINTGNRINPGDALLIAINENRMNNKTGYDWRNTFNDIKIEACKIVDKWDVRMVGNLISLFPSIIPEKYQGSIPRCELNANCDWIIIF